MRVVERGMRAAAVLALCLTVCAGVSGDQPAPDKVRVLFQVGGRVHDAVKLPRALKTALEATGRFAVTITQDRDQLLPASIRNYDVVLIYATRIELAREQEQGLTDFVARGGGLVGIHAATSCCMRSNEFWKMMGGRFVNHGGGTFRVKITGKSHVIVEGMPDFTVTDETYRHKFDPDSKTIVLMRRVTDGDPVSWVHYYGKGRVFVTGLGHDKKVWDHPSFGRMIERGLLWAAGRLNP